MNLSIYISKLLILVVSISVACTGKNPDRNKGATVEEELITSPAISIFDWNANGLQVLEDPNNPKGHITFIKFGEPVLFLGKTATDSVNGKEFSLLELSDGTTGWSRSDFLILNATRGAVINDCDVYERPDILTKSAKKSYKVFDLVAVGEEKEGYLLVTGRNKKNIGWVMKENISTEREDSDMAILVRRELLDDKGEIIYEKLNEFINNAPFPGSKIVSILREKLIEFVDKISTPETMGYDAQHETD